MKQFQPAAVEAWASGGGESREYVGIGKTRLREAVAVVVLGGEDGVCGAGCSPVIVGVRAEESSAEIEISGRGAAEVAHFDIFSLPNWPILPIPDKNRK